MVKEAMKQQEEIEKLHQNYFAENDVKSSRRGAVLKKKKEEVKLPLLDEFSA